MVESKEEVEEFIESLHDVGDKIEEFRIFIEKTISEDNGSDELEGTHDESHDENEGVIIEEEIAGLFISSLGILEADMDSYIGFADHNTLTTVKDLNEDIQSALGLIRNTIEEYDENGDLPVNAEYAEKLAIDHFLSDNIILFYSLNLLIIEKYSAQLIEWELISDKYVDTNRTEELVERRFSQEMREQLLLRTGIIDEGTVSEMSRVRDVRNSLAHGPTEKHYSEFEDLEKSDLERATNILSNLNEKIEEQKKDYSE